MERFEVVYRLSADEMVDGVEAFEVAAIIYAFADLVQETMNETGADGELSVNVKPFEEGSFITEFIVTYSSSIVDLFTSQEATALAAAMTILGFCGAGAKTLPGIIRRVKGHINEYKANDDGTFTYGEGKEAATVDAKTHAVVQSSKVAPAFKKVSVGPIVGSNNKIQVTIQEKSAFERGETGSAAHFTSADKADIEMYEYTAKNGVPEEKEEIVSVTHGVALSPIAGRYDGGENGYTFKLDEETTYKRVQMHDPEFRLKLESGAVRFMNRDLLIVDLEATQTITKSNKASTSYSIINVVDYRPYVPPEQSTVFDVLDDEGGSD